MTFLPGQTVTYHHGMLDEDIRARVLKISPRGVVVELDDAENGWPRDRRFLTHKQASACLTTREEV